MTASVNNALLNSIGVAQAQTAVKKQELGQADFLKLMTAQLQYQDPMKPMDNAQFIGQMAQFSTVSGIQGLQDSFTKLATSLQSTDTLQAAGLVGHSVLVPGSAAALGSSGGISGAIDVPASGAVTVDIADASGAVVRQINLGTQGAGLAAFNWDGLSNTGERLAAGAYQFKARVDNNGQTQSASTYVVATVNSVSLGSGGLTLDLQGLGPVAFGQVRQIM